MPVKFISKDGVADRMTVADSNVPIVAIKPTGFTETGPGIITHAIGEIESSVSTPVERMGAASPWISKAGHAVAAANAKDPPGEKPSMRFKPALSKGYEVVTSPKKQRGKPVGPTATPAGQANAGGYEGASGSGGYS